ncbi:MAG: translation initiation factor IF-2 [Ruminococcaceae bacterium]|nr:translation initiation factor IF-2 [Oscillospiraceae bacterium]
MAATTTNLLKVTQLSKDMNMKSKDVMEVLSGKGITPKSQTTLEPAQFEVLFDALTKANQIDNIGNYLDGVTYIPSKKKPAAAKPPKEESAATEVKTEAKPEVKAEPKTETKEQPKSAKVAEGADAPKTEVKKEEVKETNKEVTSEKKAAPAPRAEQPKAQSAAPKQEVKQDTKPAQQRPSAPTRDAKPYGGAQTGASQRPAYGQRPEQRAFAPQGGMGNQTDRNNGRAQFGQFGGQGGQRPNNQRTQGQRNDRSHGSGGFDKDERQQRGPVNSFKPQPIVRSQTAKGDEAPKQRGATRVVDMRAGSVDLSKYDERLDNFVPDSVADVRGGNQRVKKQVPGRMQQNFGGKGKDKGAKGKKSAQPVTKAPTSVTLPEEIMVSDLASRLKVTSAEVVKRLMMLGMMVTVNQTVDYDTAAIVADEMGIAATKEVVVTIEERLFDEEEDSEENLVGRAPVVCVMGHVDHGKTSILDAIRHTSVTTGEAGGITQHIGAYRVKANGQDITFLDTPGHEAFTAMRARGAQATDIAILVVAADDGIMPQTIEAINHAKAAGIDIIVAINKMDKPTANPDAVKQELTKYDLVPEEWGGDVICVPVSALTGFGISDLLENVLLVAEVKELKANPKRRAKGIVIEAKLDKGRGPVATVLVQNGTLHSGDIVIAGTAVGHVRAMTDHNGRTLKTAGPSVPVEIIGLAEVPSSGDEFNVVADERMARELADQRREQAKEEVFKANARANLNDLFAQISEGVKQLNIIVKADVGGSAEAVKQSLEKISNDEVKVCVIHAAAGGIREGDVTLAAASNAIVVGFNVRPDKVALDSAERQNVEIRTYRVIYDCINEITDAMKGMLAPEYKEVLLGHAEVRQTIHVPGVGTIAGSYIQDGKVTRSAMIRVVRDGIVIFEDKISSLKRFKDDAKEVAQGYECGIGLDRFNDIKVGDVLEAYVMEEIAR